MWFDCFGYNSSVSVLEQVDEVFTVFGDGWDGGGGGGGDVVGSGEMDGGVMGANEPIAPPRAVPMPAKIELNNPPMPAYLITVPEPGRTCPPPQRA